MLKPKAEVPNVEIARKCLGLIRDIADRAASSWDQNTVAYALQELSQVLLEQTGEQERVFEVSTCGELGDLPALLAELDWVNSSCQEFCRSCRCN
jgi:hypothetical protein